ncbi:MAG: tetratricopeptide repeat protein, partial [Planctomycetota bacterium]
MSVYTAQQHFNDAEDYKKKGLLQEAIASYKKAIEADASFVSAYYNLALAYHQAQQPDQAIVNLKKVTELDPGDASAFNNLGVLYVAMNRLNDAKGCFEKALSIEGDYQDARDNLEKVLQKLQKSGLHTDVQQTIQMHHRNIGFVTLWYERGQAYITKSIRDALDSEYNTFVFARNGGTADKPLLKTTGEWDVPNLTVYPEYKIPREALKDWIVKNYLTAVFFNEEADLGLVELARQCGAKTIGYYI